MALDAAAQLPRPETAACIGSCAWFLASAPECSLNSLTALCTYWHDSWANNECSFAPVTSSTAFLPFAWLTIHWLTNSLLIITLQLYCTLCFVMHLAEKFVFSTVFVDSILLCQFHCILCAQSALSRHTYCNLGVTEPSHLIHRYLPSCLTLHTLKHFGRMHKRVSRSALRHSRLYPIGNGQFLRLFECALIGVRWCEHEPLYQWTKLSIGAKWQSIYYRFDCFVSLASSCVLSVPRARFLNAATQVVAWHLALLHKLKFTEAYRHQQLMTLPVVMAHSLIW